MSQLVVIQLDTTEWSGEWDDDEVEVVVLDATWAHSSALNRPRLASAIKMRDQILICDELLGEPWIEWHDRGRTGPEPICLKLSDMQKDLISTHRDRVILWARRLLQDETDDLDDIYQALHNYIQP